MRDGLLTQIREDWRANGQDWTKPGFRTLAVHRFGVWRMGFRSKLVRAPLSLMYRALFRHCRNVYGIDLVSLGGTRCRDRASGWDCDPRRERYRRSLHYPAGLHYGATEAR